MTGVTPADASAIQINEAHRMATSHADSAIEYVIECGRLLIATRDQLQRGDFRRWVAQNCSFSQATATKYMTAAREDAAGVAFSSLKQLFPSKPKTRAPAKLNENATPCSILEVPQLIDETQEKKQELANEAQQLQLAVLATAGHAIKIGHMLRAVQASMTHGEFQIYVDRFLEFPLSTARKYMKAAELNDMGLAIDSLSDMFPGEAS